MDPQLPKEKQKNATPFILNKTKVNDFGFNLSSQNKLLSSPFNQQVMKAHPFLAKFPQVFQSFDFSMQKVINKLTDETLIYIFYNIMDQKLQIQAAKFLMQKNFKYHKVEKIWVRYKEGKFQYFNIIEWQYMDYPGNVSAENFYYENDFSQK